MPDQLHFTDSEEANRLIARDPFAHVGDVRGARPAP